MMSSNSLQRFAMAAACGATLFSSSATSARTIHVPEICMRVTAPDHRAVCLSRSPTWGYIHGIEFDIDPNRNCKRGTQGSTPGRIGIWQDANPGDDTADDYVATSCGHSKVTRIRDERDRLAGMRSSFCSIPEGRGGIRVHLIGYAGRWEGHAQQPAIFYRAWMVTQRARLRQDMSFFKAFARSARIESGRCLADLSD
jgi:hypothetical protein